MSLFNFPILGDERANYTLTLLVFTHNSTLNEKENVCSKRLIFWTPINWAPPAWAVLAPWRQRENLIPGLGYSPSSISILSSTNALPSLGNKVAPSVLILLLLSSLSPSLRTSKPVSLSLWGIETVNAWGFDVPLLCEPSQSSAGACLPSLHHLIILCGGRGRRAIMKLSLPHMHPSLRPRDRIPAPDNTNAFRDTVHSLALSLFYFVASSAAHSMTLKLSPASFEGLGIEGRRRDRRWISKAGAGVAALPDSGVKQQNMTSIKRGS